MLFAACFFIDTNRMIVYNYTSKAIFMKKRLNYERCKYIPEPTGDNE